jgi:hypothetical protein
VNPRNDSSKTTTYFPWNQWVSLLRVQKLSSSAGQQIRFQAHCQLAKVFFLQKQILFGARFEEVGWELVHATLLSVP